jgi:hypothetical protein
MKNATSVIVPKTIQDFVLHTFNEKEIRSHKTGCNSFIPDLTKAVSKYISDNSCRFSLLGAIYQNGISEDCMKRFFNYKTPHGATKHLRDATALYATDGEKDWNGLIKTYFPDYSHLLDCDEQPEDEHPQHITNDMLYIMLKELLNRTPPRNKG